MAYLSSNRTNPDYVSIVITYRTTNHDTPLYIVSSANGWNPEVMELIPSKQSVDREWTTTFKVNKSVGCVTYKFRLGNGDWIWDHNLPTEHDGFGGMNNRFDIPADLLMTPPPETSVSIPDDELYLEPESQTALPSPVMSHRPDTEHDDSISEIEAPSISDWDPASDGELLAGSPVPKDNASTYAMSENTDWEVV